ncbi:MAG: hypothetical protein GTN78_15805, partial [Gemmatimonadales bacterium]|nr:hypothetical protein [Gemmatimonadales bacterium]
MAADAGTALHAGATRRAAFVGALLLVVVLAVLGFWFDIYAWAAERFGAGVPASGPFAVLFLLAVAASTPRIGQWLNLRRAELLAIYGVLVASSPLVSSAV